VSPVNAIVIRRGAATTVVVGGSVVVGGGCVVDGGSVGGVGSVVGGGAVGVIGDGVAAMAPVCRSGGVIPLRTADTSTEAHAVTRQSPSSATARPRMRTGSHVAVGRRWIPWVA
jgi:hypothetical protein